MNINHSDALQSPNQVETALLGGRTQIGRQDLLISCNESKEPHCLRFHTQDFTCFYLFSLCFTLQKNWLLINMYLKKTTVMDKDLNPFILPPLEYNFSWIVLIFFFRELRAKLSGRQGSSKGWRNIILRNKEPWKRQTVKAYLYTRYHLRACKQWGLRRRRGSEVFALLAWRPALHFQNLYENNWVW